MKTENTLLTTGRWGDSIKDFFLLTALWLTSIIIINPIGNFPLNDDWSFGMAVENFLQTGSFHPTGWTSMPLITNVLWGSLFCLPKGFSFTALRFSTLAAAWLGMGGIYWLMREIRQPRLLAWGAAFLVAFNPIYLTLTNSFMTDVLCLTLMTFSTIFFLKNLQNNSYASLAVATAISVAAILSRQVALAVPMAYAVVAIRQRGIKPRTVVAAVFPAILGMLVLTAFQHWLKATNRWPALYSSGSAFMLSGLKHPGQIAGAVVYNSFTCMMYLGLFLTPLLPLIGSGISDFKNKQWRWLAGIWLALAGVLIIGGYYGKGFSMPLSNDMLSIWGMGPLTLHDAIYVMAPGKFVLGQWLWTAITVVSLIAAGLILHRLGRLAIGFFSGGFFFKPKSGDHSGMFLLLVALIYAGPFMLNGFYDRYLIPLIPFLIGGLAFYRPQPSLFVAHAAMRCIAILLAVGLLIYSVGSVKDYMSWNRTRWLALYNLMTMENKKPTDIDGGLEFNGYYLYNSTYRPEPGKSMWWVADDSYVVTFNPIPGYDLLHSYPYQHWLPPFVDNILVLKKATNSPTVSPINR